MSPYDLPRLFMSVAAPYRSVGIWQASTTMFQNVLEWRDSTDQPIVQELTSSPSGLGIFGHPLLENPAMDAVASATQSLALGDFSLYSVIRLPVRVELSRDHKWSTHQVSLRVIERVDGRLLDASGLAYLVSANT